MSLNTYVDVKRGGQGNGGHGNDYQNDPRWRGYELHCDQVIHRLWDYEDDMCSETKYHLNSDYLIPKWPKINRYIK